MIAPRYFLSLYSIGITGILAATTANNDDNDRIYDYDVLEYIDPLIGSAAGGIIEACSHLFTISNQTFTSRQCIRRSITPLRHGQSRSRHRLPDQPRRFRVRWQQHHRLLWPPRFRHGRLPITRKLPYIPLREVQR